MALAMALAVALETIFPRLFKSAKKIARPALKPFNAKSCAGNLEKMGSAPADQIDPLQQLEWMEPKAKPGAMF